MELPSVSGCLFAGVEHFESRDDAVGAVLAGGGRRREFDAVGHPVPQTAAVAGVRVAARVASFEPVDVYVPVQIIRAAVGCLII